MIESKIITTFYTDPNKGTKYCQSGKDIMKKIGPATEEFSLHVLECVSCNDGLNDDDNDISGFRALNPRG